MKVAQTSEAGPESAARISCFGTIASMYAFANGVPCGGPLFPQDRHTARLSVGVHGTLSADRHDLPGTIPLLRAGKNVEVIPDVAGSGWPLRARLLTTPRTSPLRAAETLSVHAVTNGES